MSFWVITTYNGGKQAKDVRNRLKENEELITLNYIDKEQLLNNNDKKVIMKRTYRPNSNYVEGCDIGHSEN